MIRYVVLVVGVIGSSNLEFSISVKPREFVESYCNAPPSYEFTSQKGILGNSVGQVFPFGFHHEGIELSTLITIIMYNNIISTDKFNGVLMRSRNWFSLILTFFC
jgi:hypothetical protein